MSIVALDKNWRIPGHWIHELLSGKLRRRPFGFVPAAAQNPFAFRGLGRLRRNTPCELLRGCHIRQVNLIQLRAALDEMHMRVVESGQH